MANATQDRTAAEGSPQVEGGSVRADSELMGTRAPQEREPAGSEEKRRLIAERAYYLAERRGFTPGYEEGDWLAAEKEIDAGQERTQFQAEDNNFPSPK